MAKKAKSEDPLTRDREPSLIKMEEASRRYQGSEKGKAVKKKYDSSPKGKGARERYLRSEKGQMALLRYYLSDKGVETRQRTKELNQLLSQCKTFLEDNPTKTVGDFLQTLQGRLTAGHKRNLKDE